MATIDPLIVKLITDNREFIDGMNKAQSVADHRLDQLEKRGLKMGQGVSKGFNLAKGAAIGFVASLGVDAVVQAVKAGLDYASSLGEVAQQLGVTTDALQEYRYAGSQAGLATEEIDMALGQLTRRIGEGVNGTKAQAEAFEKLGISLKDAKGNVIATGDAIPLIADALQKIKSPAEQSALLLDLFGKSGQKLLPLLSEGSKGVNGLRNAAQELGLVLSSKQIEQADKTADKLDALKQVLAAKIAGAVADNAGSILELAGALVVLVGSIGDAIRKYKEFRETFGATGQIAIGQALGGAGSSLGGRFIQSGVGRLKQQAAEQRLAGAPRTSLSKLGQTLGPKSNFAGGGLFGNQGFGAPGAGTGLDVKNLQGLLVAELIGPTKAQAKAISEATIAVEQQNADLAVALADLSGSVTERAAAEKLRIDVNARSDAEQIKANDGISKAEKEKLLAINTELAGVQKRIVDQQLAKEIADRALESAEKLANAREANVDLELAALDAESAIATSVKERAAIEQRILEIQQAEERSRLEAAIAAGQIADAAKARADLARKQGADKVGLARDGQGAGANELDRLNGLNFGDEAERFGVDALKDLNSELARAAVYGGDVGDILENSFKRLTAQLIEVGFQLLVIKPLLESLKSAGGSGGGGFLSSLGTALGSVFGGASGRASGGPVSAGQVYRVNEGVGQEFFRPSTGGDIIPLSKMNAMQGGGNAQAHPVVIQVYADEGSTFVPRVEAISAGVSVEVVRTAAPAIRDSAVNETFRRGQRPSLGR